MGGDLIQTPQTRWIQGAYESVQRGTLIHLVCRIDTGVAEERYSALRVPGAAAGYQVTAGKTLYLTRVMRLASIVTSRWQTASGTADAGDNQLAQPAGYIHRDSGQINTENALTGLTANVIYDHNIFTAIPENTYPCVRLLSASCALRCSFYGHEE